MGFISEILGKVLSGIGSAFASTGSQGCVFVFFDEPKMPKTMLKK